MLAITPLGAYLIPQWNDLDGEQRALVTLIAADGRLVSKAATPALDVYALDDFPRHITLSLITFQDDVENEQQVTLVIDE